VTSPPRRRKSECRILRSHLQILQVILIRPGQTDYDLQERIQGTLDIPLNEQGLNDAAKAAEQLKSIAVEAIYAPPQEPAFQTAKIIAQTLSVKQRKLDRLQNLNMGLWQGMLIQEIRHKNPKVYRQWQEQPESVCPPEGEMLEEATERVHTAMMKLLKKHKEGIIAICVPEPLLSLVRQFFLHCELGDLWTPPEGCRNIECFKVEPEELLALSAQ
jgi:broad specificity phosphatase PhoE